MRSSGSTPSRSGKPPIRLFVRIVGDDHPKACTGRRLVRRGLAREVRGSQALPALLLLDPFARDPISPADRDLAERSGILAIDCSWNRLGARGAFAGDPPEGARRRRLPFLIAANPQHFGRIGELNTVEALAAALSVVGRPSEAARLLEGFPGGPAFLTVNGERLREYGHALGAGDIRDAERRLFGPAER